jgi:hypothetical protein
LWLVILISARAMAASAQDADISLRLVLHDGATFAGVPEAGSPAVLIDVESAGGVWERGWAASAGFGHMEREVRVDRAAIGKGKMELALTVSQPSLGAQTGERLKYIVTVARNDRGGWTGEYAGDYRGAAIKGGARAEIRAARQVEAGYRPLEQGEHPRLLFRKSEVEALRKKAQTPFGKLAMSKMPDSAAGLAMKHQMTGEQALAAEARKRVEAAMADAEHGDKRVRSRWFGLRIEQVALAYDLCYDAWPVDFRAQVAEYLHGQLEILFHQRGSPIFDGHLAWTMAASHAPPLLYAGGMAGLALRGEKGEKPAKPETPALMAGDFVVEGAKDFAPAKGAPVVDFKSGEMPRAWLYAGQFPAGGDHLASLGGRAAAKPGEGTVVKAGEKSFTFVALVDKGYHTSSLTGNRTQIELTGPNGVMSHTVGYYYLVVRNDAERWVKFDTNNGSIEAYLGGTRIAGGDVMRLKAGMYPLLVVGPLGDVKPWGKVFMEPKFTQLTAEEAQPVIATARARFEDRLKDWEFDTAQWERTGGSDVRFLRDFEHAGAIMALVFGETPGEGGMALGGEDMLSIDGPNKYAMAHRVAMGTNPTRLDDVAAILPYKMFVHTMRADGKALGLEANGLANFQSASYPDNSRPTTMDNFATLYRLARDEWKPAVLWGWNFFAGGGGDEARWTRVLTTGSRGGWAYSRPYGTFDTHPLYAFVSYPIGVEPRSPQGVMPLTCKAPGGGFYGFRNNWSGTDDEFITHFYGATPAGGAGTLRVVGLGQVWSHGLNAAAPARFGENVVQLPENVLNEKARGAVTFVETRDDGSGAITVDLADVYTAPRTDENDRAEQLYERLGGYRRPSAFVDQGIAGRRALAVDYSGKSGAPCLIVIVDSIKGGGPKLWTWQLQSKQEGTSTTRNEQGVIFEGKQFPYKHGLLLKSVTRKLDDDPTVKVAANGFVLARGNATLAATFVSPAAPKVQLAERVEVRVTVKSGAARNTSRAIFAEGGDSFFVVLTIQRGDAPTVTAEGQGLDARVKVGGQTVRFDGEKIVLGQ